MYDRILQLLTERSKSTRAKIAAMGGNAAFKQAAGDQKADPLAQRAAVAAKKAKVAGVQSQGRSQSTVHIAGTSRKAARAAGQELIGTTGRSGSKLPRVAPTAAKPETDQRGLVPVPSTRALVPVPSTRAVVPASRTTRDVVPVGPEIQGQGNRKPIKPRDPGVEDAEFTVKPDRMPFNRTYRRVLGALKGARPIVGMKPKGLNVNPVTNAFNVGKDQERTIAGTQRNTNKQDDKRPDSRTAAVKDLLKGLTGRKSMHNRPSYRP